MLELRIKDLLVSINLLKDEDDHYFDETGIVHKQQYVVVEFETFIDSLENEYISENPLLNESDEMNVELVGRFNNGEEIYIDFTENFFSFEETIEDLNELREYLDEIVELRLDFGFFNHEKGFSFKINEQKSTLYYRDLSYVKEITGSLFFSDLVLN